MKELLRIVSVLIPLIGSAILAGCGEQKTTNTEPSPRPVTAIELREMNPVKPLQLTGSVKSWKEQDVAFEVDGRVEWIVEMGTNLQGRWQEGGKVRVQGDKLARLDKRPYTIGRETAAAAMEVAKRQLNEALIQLKQVLPANLRAAKAEKDRAEAEYIRYKRARERKAVAEVDFIRATADRDSRQAKFEQANADVEAKKAGIETHRANIKEAEQRLNDTQYDLERCTLFSPFSGEVSEVYIEAGGYAQKGQPVAHLVMMDPIKIDLAVSSATAARLRLRNSVQLFLPGDTEPTYGTVYEKATIADPETRTFRVSIITRNQQIIGDFPPGDPLLEYPRIKDYQYLWRVREGDEESSFVVEERRALRRDQSGSYVWAAPDRKIGDPIDSRRPLLTLRKFRVTPGQQSHNLQGLYLARELVDIGELIPGTLIALDVPDNFEDGGQVLVVRNQWRLHPGQIVSVLLGESPPVPGLYVPMNAIKPIDDKSGDIFIAADGKARKVKVKLLGNVGELFRVEAANPGGSGLITAGSRIITDYIHFLVDGEPVRIVKMTELKP